MTAVGVIVEYNPFHNGHKWHLEMARRKTGCSHIIGIMSGNFVQRGEPAIFDKWKRAEMAVKEGIDLVIELPAVFAVRSAQHFAEGGVRLLASLGIVSHLCFGAECTDINLLKAMAEVSDRPETIHKIQSLMKDGVTYAAALATIIKDHCRLSEDEITLPNNILAVEYIKAIKKYAPYLIPTAISRVKANYHDTDITSSIASATAVRQSILANQTITSLVAQALPAGSLSIARQCLHDGRGPVTFPSLEKIILARLRMLTIKELESLPEVTEGLHNKIHSSALDAINIKDLLSLVKSKRYPFTRLQRILIHASLGTTKNIIAEFDERGPLYARILAFNSNGRQLLKYLNLTSKIPIIIKTAVYLNSKQRASQELSQLKHMLSIDTIASDMYFLGMPNAIWNRGGWDFRLSPLYIRD